MASGRGPATFRTDVGAVIQAAGHAGPPPPATLPPWAFPSHCPAEMMLTRIRLRSSQLGEPDRGDERGPVMPEQNPFFEGSFAPVQEEITAFDLPVTGTLPPELNGCYLRNGPNPMGLEDPGARWGDGHWFLGSGMVHGVRLRDGRAEWYRNRWVRSRQVASTLGEKWPGGPVHDDVDFAANTHIIRHAGRVLATVKEPARSLPAHRRAGDRGAVRLRWETPGRLRRAHQAGPAHRGTARHRLLLGLGPRSAHRRRRDRPGHPHHEHPGSGRPDDARLRAD